MAIIEKYYFSPPPGKRKTNEYVNNFYYSLSREVDLINYNQKISARSVDYLKYAFRADVMILNWPEDILHLRYGIFQLVMSFFTFILFKLKGGRLIWVCHNKDSHTKRHKTLRKLTRRFFTALSDKIIVHSCDALSFFNKNAHKVHFLNHPVYDHPRIINEISSNADIDVLIWGKICAYKGLNEFIDNYKKYHCFFKVLIVGEADKKYKKILEKKATDTNITIVDKFISDEELECYFKRCKLILLPYLDSDTFSSGALIHSLNSNRIILGPRVGNFIDLEKYRACITYSNEQDMFQIIDELLADKVKYLQNLESLRKGILDYQNSNSWHNFIMNLLHIIKPD